MFTTNTFYKDQICILMSHCAAHLTLIIIISSLLKVRALVLPKNDTTLLKKHSELSNLQGKSKQCAYTIMHYK